MCVGGNEGVNWVGINTYTLLLIKQITSKASGSTQGTILNILE